MNVFFSVISVFILTAACKTTSNQSRIYASEIDSIAQENNFNGTILLKKKMTFFTEKPGEWQTGKHKKN